MHRSASFVIRSGPATLPILGLPAETEVDDITLHIEIGAVRASVALGAATTGSLPEELIEPEVILAGDGRMRPEPFLLTSVDIGPEPFFGPCYAVILDAQGRIVWYLRTPGDRLTWQARPSRFGGILVDELVTYAFGDPGPPLVRRVTLDLTHQQTTELPGMMLAFDELPDGSFIHDERETETAFHLVRLHPDGRSERLWSCAPWMEPWHSEFWSCATNTTLWSESRGSVLWSTFETGILAEIDAETGALLEAYGDHPDAFPVIPASAALHRPHLPNWTGPDTLIVSVHDADARQWAREYVVDEQQGVLREIFSIESPVWAEYGGQVQRLPSGGLLWQFGTAGVIRELTDEGIVLWQVQWPGHLVGNATPIADLYTLLSLEW